VATGTV